MLKRVWRQWPNLRSSVFHTSVLPSFFDNVPCSLAKADLSSSRLPSKLTSTSRLANQCSQLKTGGYIFLTSAPHKTSHGSSLLVSPIPLLNEICSSQHYSTFTCQGTYCVHYSLIFIVYTILFTICTLLKLFTIGYIAGSGGKNKGYSFKTSQLSSITRMEDDQHPSQKMCAARDWQSSQD